MSEGEVINNPKRYREMSVPHESGEKFQEALDAFFKDVEAARVKHRIQDVIVIGRGTMKLAQEAEGVDEGQGQAMAHFGDAMRAQGMLAQALGTQQAVDNDRVRLLREIAMRKASGKR